MRSDLKLKPYDLEYLGELKSECPWLDDDRLAESKGAWMLLGDQFPFFEYGRLNWNRCVSVEFLSTKGRGVREDWAASREFVKARAPGGVDRSAAKGWLIGTAISFSIEMTLEEFVEALEPVVYGCQDFYYHLPSDHWCVGIGEEGDLCVASNASAGEDKAGP